MISAVLIWYVCLALVGLLALPLTTQLFRFLPDRGVALARVVGLLLCGLAYWLLVTFGLLHNSRSAVFVVVAGLGVASWGMWLRDREFLKKTWADIRESLLLSEVLLFAVFIVLVIFVAYRPDISATEKPMEFAFINGILRSETFPPADPWLSRYGISYYYFGYIIAAFTTLLSGVSSSITYNLVAATVFAFAFVGAFSLVRNMVLSRKMATKRGGIGAGLLGGFLTVFMGNLEGIFEVMRSRGIGSSALFEWLDVRNLTVGSSGTWIPTDMWWWWRASRVIHDRNSLGQSVEVIDEFPFFSLVLGDIHPHVLALPFVMLALALSLNVLLMPVRQRTKEDSEGEAGSIVYRFFSGQLTGWRGDPWLWGLLLGAFGFLNTWDLPVYLGLFLVALGVREVWATADWRAWLGHWGLLALSVGLIAIFAYMPFYVTLRSQAGGFALVDVKTQPQQFMLMFGVFIVALVGYVGSLVISDREKNALPAHPGLLWAAGGMGGLLVLVCVVLGWWTAAIALSLATVAALLLFAGLHRDGSHLDAATTLALLMTIGGMLLVASVEFVMLKDSFGTRMNTVFKFYYAGWLLLACASAWGIHQLVQMLHKSVWWHRLLTAGWLVVVVILMLAGGTYTIAATVSRANGFSGVPSLDGTAYVGVHRADEQAVINWLTDNAPPNSVLVEAVGGSYTEYGWISAATGVPTLLGWTGHELQWRGSYEIPAEREKAVELVYTSSDTAAISAILATYDVDYVIVGPRERAAYGISENTMIRMEQLLDVAFEFGDYVVYVRR